MQIQHTNKLHCYWAVDVTLDDVESITHYIYNNKIQLSEPESLLAYNNTVVLNLQFESHKEAEKFLTHKELFEKPLRQLRR